MYKVEIYSGQPYKVWRIMRRFDNKIDMAIFWNRLIEIRPTTKYRLLQGRRLLYTINGNKDKDNNV